MAKRASITRETSLLPSRLSRRAFVGSQVIAGVACFGWASNTSTPALAQSPPPANTNRTVLLVQPQQIQQLSTRTKIVLEVEGILRLKEKEAGGSDASSKSAGGSLDVKGKSTLDYYEKTAFSPDPQTAIAIPQAAARHYHEAVAENWVAGTTTKIELRPDCKATRMMAHQGLWQQYCETNPLDSREVELLHSPINSAAIELLLPLEPAKPDSNWTVRSEDARLIFNLDAVHKSSLSARLTKVQKGVATIEVKGDLDATARSVPTRLSISGSFQTKLASGCALVTWLGLVIKEDRQLSQAEPGFAITARVRMIREETESKLSITDAELRKLAVQSDSGRWLVRLRSTVGQFSMLADRRWHIHLDSGEEAILRMVENNTVIAQCSINRLTELQPGQQLTLEGLQADIKQSIGTGFGSFLESSEKITATKLRLIRSVVAGELEEVPIQWIYDHLSDDQGRRLAMIFTMGGNVTDRFGAADEQMSTTFEILPEPQSAAKTIEAQKNGEAQAAPKQTATKPAQAPQR